MKKIWTVAKLGVKECMRYKIVYFIVLMSIVFIFWGRSCKPAQVKTSFKFFDQQARQTLAVNIAFHGIVFWSVLLCGLLSANILAREFDEETAIMTMSRPVRRSSFVAGKVLSTVMVSGFALFFLGGVFSVLFLLEMGVMHVKIFLSLGCVILSILLYSLMGIFFSMFLPRLITPLVSIVIYMISLWAAFPYHFEKIRLVWDPSERVALLHRFWPRFGDLQFFSARFMSSYPDLSEIAMPVCNILIYSLIFWILIVFVMSRRQL